MEGKIEARKRGKGGKDERRERKKENWGDEAEMKGKGEERERGKA